MTTRRWLNRDRVIERAARMADEAAGPPAVTLAALAADLGVRPPSLYNHVGGLDDLHRGLAAHATRLLLDELRRAAAGLVGRDALLALAGAYRRFAREHPGLYPLIVPAPGPDNPEQTAAAAELLHFLLLVMASLGLTGDDALHAIRGLRAVLHGFVSVEAADGYRMPLSHDESYRRLLDTYLDGLTGKSSAATPG